MGGSRYAMGSLLLLLGLALLYMALTPKGQAIWSVLTANVGGKQEAPTKPGDSDPGGGGGGFSNGGGDGGGGGGFSAGANRGGVGGTVLV